MTYDPTKPRKRTKAQERHYAEMLQELEQLEAETQLLMRKTKTFPRDWYGTHDAAPIKPPKDRITLRLDRDMLTFYRNMGRGWQPRMNAVLRAYMNALLAKEIEQVGDRRWDGEAI